MQDSSFEAMRRKFPWIYVCNYCGSEIESEDDFFESDTGSFHKNCPKENKAVAEDEVVVTGSQINRHNREKMAEIVGDDAAERLYPQ